MKGRVILSDWSDEDDRGAGYAELLCAVTHQALIDARRWDYGAGVEALQYLNAEPVQALHECIGVNLRGEWTREKLRRHLRRHLKPGSA